MRRFDIRDQIATLDPATEYTEISRLLTLWEFPWDFAQSLGFALFRTYAVPTIGDLLGDTEEFTQRTQKRYDDTALILDEVLASGPESLEGRAAIRRMNQMHGAYEITNDDFLYVLATFVVIPIRWIQRFGWRKLSDNEIDGLTNYQRRIGRLMGLKNIPATYAEFSSFLDEYERDYFGFSVGGRAVGDATLTLMATLPPNQHIPASWTHAIARASMEPHLLAAFHYENPPQWLRVAVAGGLKLRGRVVRFTRPRRKELRAADSPLVRSYPNGFTVAELGTFPRGCPVPHGANN